MQFCRLICSVVVLSALGLWLTACSQGEHSGRNAEGKPIIVVPVPPYAYVVEKLAGDAVDLHVMVGEEDDPHSYSPTPKEVATLAQSMVYFTAGLPFEGALTSKIPKGTEIISIVSNLKRREFAEGEHEHHDLEAHGEKEHKGHDHHDHEGHDHDHDHDHHHHGHDHGEHLDPHVWLSPILLAQQVAQIGETLRACVADPELAKQITGNQNQLIAELGSLDSELEKTLAPLKGSSFYTYHGAFGYLADAYGLRQEAIEISGRSPEPKQIAELIKKAQADQVTLILVQPQFDQSSAKSLAEAIGGQVVPINPLAKEVPDNLRKLAALIAR